MQNKSTQTYLYQGCLLHHFARKTIKNQGNENSRPDGTQNRQTTSLFLCCTRAYQHHTANDALVKLFDAGGSHLISSRSNGNKQPVTVPQGNSSITKEDLLILQTDGGTASELTFQT